MKIRKGFVSNSSSSSFVCEFCGEEYSGMDANLSDAKMVECEGGHTICESHKLDVVESKLTIELKREKLLDRFSYRGEEWKQSIREGSSELIEDEWEECSYEFDTECSAEACPLCQLEGITDRELALFLLTKMGVTKKEYLKTLKDTYGTLAKMMESIK